MNASDSSLEYTLSKTIELEKKINARVGDISEFIVKSLIKNNFNVEKAYIPFRTLVTDVLNEEIDDDFLLEFYYSHLHKAIIDAFSLQKDLRFDFIEKLITEVKEELKKKEWLTFRYINEGILSKNGISRYLKRILPINLGISETFNKLLDVMITNFVDSLEDLHQRMLQNEFLSNFLTHRGIIILSELFESIPSVFENTIDYYGIPLIMTDDRVVAVTISKYARGLLGLLEEKYNVTYTYLPKPKIPFNKSTLIMHKKGFPVKFNLEFIKPLIEYIAGIYYPNKIAPLILLIGAFAVLLAPLSEE